MAKSTVWQWDKTAANNTDVAGIDISGVTGKVKDGDNAIRAAMSQIITMEGKGSDVASAGTLTLGTERYYHVTGTTTITDIDFTDAVDGRWAWLVFDGALTLTHNSTTLKLPGSANIVTEAGDRALVVQDNGDNVICLFFQRAAAIPATYGTWTPVVTFGGGSTGIAYSTQTGTWWRTGNIVVAHCNVALSNKGSSTGAMVISGLPFANGSLVSQGVSVGSSSGFTGLTGALGADVSSTTFRPYQSTSTGNTSITNAECTNTTAIRCGGAYIA
jgi:hypothetical protein